MFRHHFVSDLTSNSDKLDDVCRSLAPPTQDMAPPIAPPRRRTTDIRVFRKATSFSTGVNCQSENNNNYESDIDKQTSSPISPVTKDLAASEDVVNQNVPPPDNIHAMGNTHVRSDSSAINNNISSRGSNFSTHKKKTNMSVNAIFYGHSRGSNNPLGGLAEASPTALPGLTCDIFDKHVHAGSDTFDRPGGMVLHGMDGIESRRRNFSSSSLPLSLMTATIEEVDDTEPTNGATSSPNQHAQRSHSYSGSVTPSPKVPFRTLRREARVTSTSSPPRTRRPGGLVRSASDNTSSIGCLKDVDIVGESFESRFPWQRDFGVQCEMTSDSVFHPNLERALSGPAMYTYFRSLSKTSSTPSSSPPLTSRQLALHQYRRSCSHSDLIHHQPAFGVCDPYTYYYYHHRSNNSIATVGKKSDTSNRDKVSHSKRLANFRSRPRPSSVGAGDNYR